MDNHTPIKQKKQKAMVILGTPKKVTTVVFGQGRCTASGCRCGGYIPNSPKNDYCRSCGHSFYMHRSV